MNVDFSKQRIAVLGAGKMGGILVKALIEKHQIAPERVRATVAHETRAHELSHKLGVAVTTDNVILATSVANWQTSIAGAVPRNNPIAPTCWRRPGTPAGSP